MSSKVVEIPIPDDFHLHLRDGKNMESLVSKIPLVYGRVLVMPNLIPPITTTEMALDYQKRILKACNEKTKTQFLMTLYLTDTTSPEEIVKAKESGQIYACKYYPAGATTNSASGVTDIKKVYPALQKMSELSMPLCIHSEIPDLSIDIFDREKEFIKQILIPLIKDHPNLKIVMEHITTKNAVDFILSTGPNVAATITPQHLLFNRNSLLVGGIKPHFYCLPILKKEKHRQALIGAIKSGSNKFFLGTDSAPHPKDKKECPSGCAGCFTMPHALELYMMAFEEAGCIENFKKFACENGADFYGFPRNGGKVVLEKEEELIPKEYEFGDSVVVPIKFGEKLSWKLKTELDYCLIPTNNLIK